MNKCRILVLGLSLSLAGVSQVWADQVISDDLIVSGSACIGADCVDGETFDFDTLRLKATHPVILFEDTSTSGGFPTMDWQLGITDEDTGQAALFYIQEGDSGLRVLQIEAGESGGVALGAGSAIETGAISVGADSAERRIVHLAPGVDATDAVNMSQFLQFTNDSADATQAEQAELDASILQLRDELNTVNARIDAIVERLEAQ